MDFRAWGVEPDRLWAFHPFMGKGVITTDGPAWEFSRSKLRPLFTHSCTSLSELVELLVTRIREHVGTVNIEPLVAQLGVDTASELLLGEIVGALASRKEDTYLNKVDAASDHCRLGASKRMELPRWEPLFRDHGFWDSCKVVHEFVGKYVHDTRESLQTGWDTHTSSASSSQYNFIEALLNEGLNDDSVREQVLNSYMAARVSVAMNISHTIFLLARHPQAWVRLRAEVVSSDIFGSSSAENIASNLKRLKYLRGVINESRRLLPALTITRRIALQDTKLPVGGGAHGKSPVLIRKGDICVTNFAALHRRRDLFGEDADEFHPERWMNEWKAEPWTFLPFGGGPRICPGQKLGYVHVAFTIAKLASVFATIENRDSKLEFVECYKLVTKSANGVKVAFQLPTS